MIIKEKRIKILAKQLIEESDLYAVRDVALLTSSIFCETHFSSFPKIFGVNFSMNFWYTRKDGMIVMHRSEKEYRDYSKKVGDEFIKDISYAQKTADKLIEMSDFINAFIKKHKKIEDLIPEWDGFFKYYRDFFAYHQTNYWPSEYLTELLPKAKNKEKIQKIIEILGKAYKYNETVAPNVEKYFTRLGISHLAFDEINQDVYKNIKNKPKKRSVLHLDGKMHILSYAEATKIEKIIGMSYKDSLKKIKEIKGMSVCKGLVKGKVKLITDLSRLKECRKKDILITTQIRPQYNNYIKNVAAIVTDDGGVLCHASLLAREFKIPCIVGTKNATKLIKNGDLVEVDANQGIVKILKKK